MDGGDQKSLEKKKKEFGAGTGLARGSRRRESRNKSEYI